MFLGLAEFQQVRAERPAVAEDHGLALSPVLEIDLSAVRERYRRGTLAALMKTARRDVAVPAACLFES
jgi:hypothetical protein